jgi:peptidoglycan/LPS O-acetylase OafA/YrhL
MLGKSRFLRVFLKLKGLQIISQLSFGISLWYPLFCLAFYFSQHQFTHLGFLNMSYYFTCSFILSILVAYLLYILIQGPMASLGQIFREQEETREGIKTFRFKFL